MFTGFPPDGATYARLMQQAWEQWQSSLAGQSPQINAIGEAQIERLLSGLKGYFELLESLQSQLGGADVSEQWRSALGAVFAGGQPFMQAFGDASALAGGGPQAWMDAFAQMQALPQTGATGLLGMPAFGFAREHQQRAQHLTRDMLDYREQMQRYNQLLARAGKLGTAKFEAKLAERTEPGRQIESLRALYDLWVDAAEEGFQEVALSPEWREVYGALVNAQMRVRAGVQQQVEGAARELGMPTRSEVDTLGKRLHDLRRQVRQLESRLAAVGDPASVSRNPGAAAGASATHTAAAKPAAKSARKPGATRRS